MNKRAETDIKALEQLVSRVVTQSRILASQIDGEPEILEELQQIAVAMHYTTQTLRLRLGLPNASKINTPPTELSSDLRMKPQLDNNLPTKT